MARIKRDWVEPAHPTLVKRFDDLVAIYRFIKEIAQKRVDSLFDGVSQRIGFVVTTTLPVTVQVGDAGKILTVGFTGGTLKGTLFEEQFAPLFKELGGKDAGKITAGTFNLFLLWHEALKLKLKTDWIEPAHFRDMGSIRQESATVAELAGQLTPGIREPAHWFDAGIAIDREEEMLIAAIDEVYADLKLAERVAVARRESLKLQPGIREPAHFRELIEDIIDARYGRQLVPGIREPAHFRDLVERDDLARLLTELVTLIKKRGL